MNILDKFALNRLIKTILDFLLKIVDIMIPGKRGSEPNEEVKPDHRPILPWRRKKKNEDNT